MNFVFVYFKDIVTLTFLKHFLFIIRGVYSGWIALTTFYTYGIISLGFKRCLLYSAFISGNFRRYYSLFLVRCKVSRICPTFQNSAVRPEPLMTLRRMMKAN